MMWIKNRNWDLFWIFSPFWVLLLSSLSRNILNIKPGGGVLQIAIILNFIHLTLPICFAVFCAREWQSHRKEGFLKSIVIFPASLFLIMLTGFYYRPILSFLLPLGIALWVTWHFYKQDLGIMSFYRFRLNDSTQTMMSFDRILVFMFTLVGPVNFWFRTGQRYLSLRPYVNPTFLDNLLPWNALPIVGSIILIFYFALQLRDRQFFTPRTLYATGLYIQFMALTPTNAHWPFFELCFIGIKHSMVELGLQSLMWKHSIKEHNKKSFRLGVVSALVLATLFGLCTQNFLILRTINQRAYFDVDMMLSYRWPVLIAVFALFVFSLQTLHYYLGRHIYNMKYPEVRELYLKFKD